MTTIDLDNRAGNQALAQWLNPSDYSTCLRCGITRRTRLGRETELCRDCRHQQAADDAAWLQFHPAERMSAEDRAWCEKAADTHFWAVTWPRANRNGTGDQLIDEAQRRARKVA